MIESKFYKDMNHNYLILKSKQGQAEDKYQLKMITDNRIPGLLGCSTRYINGEAYLYYEVNSLQSLKTLYEYRKMNRQQAVCILAGLRRVLREIQAYLLVDNGLLLMQEYVFTNWETGEVYFVYYPDEAVGTENKIQTFMEFMAEVIDHQDPQLVDMVYGLCQLAESGRFAVNELDYYLSGASTSDESKGSAEPKLHKEEVSKQVEDHEEQIIDREEEKPVLVPPLERTQEVKFAIMVLVSAAGVGTVLFIQNRYLLTSREALISWVLLFTFLLILLIAGALYLILKFSICTEKRPAINSVPDAETQEWKEQNHIPVPAAAEPERYGDTVFLYSTEEARENKLYGISKGNKYHIDLSALPCTVGKMADGTNCCIADPSISRMHVKFTGEGKAVYMTDLNSTNGTYKNGLRLQPSETVAIEPGDEVRLGKLIFCYR